MKIEAATFHHIVLPLVTPFETSFGRETIRPCILVELHSEGLTGWGECVAFGGPWYSYETTETAWHVMTEYLAPQLLGKQVSHPEDLNALFSRIRGHNMARSTIETAVWDLYAKSQGLSVSQIIGGTRDRISVGVSVGITPTVDTLLAQVGEYVSSGYQRVKLKIKPGWDVEIVAAVRERWPDLMLQVDANSAYTLDHLPIFKELDKLNLLLIEQPLHHDDIVDHAKLQSQLNTPICLDESIHSVAHARWAIDIDATRVINIKIGRVGGLGAAKEIHDLCQERGIPVWCGGMLETNIGRAMNIALASLPNFTLPGDVSASNRYYHTDIASPDFTLNSDSTVTVPIGKGIGVEVNPDRLAKVRVRIAEMHSS